MKTWHWIAIGVGGLLAVGLTVYHPVLLRGPKVSVKERGEVPHKRLVLLKVGSGVKQAQVGRSRGLGRGSR